MRTEVRQSLVLRFNVPQFCVEWLGRAMVLDSFQCRGVLLLWHIVGQGPVVLAAGGELVDCFLCVFWWTVFMCIFISSTYLSFSNASSL